MTIEIDDPETERSIEVAASLAGMSVGDYAREVLRINAGLSAKPRSLRDLRGLWSDISRQVLKGRAAQEYVNAERDEWDTREN